MSFYLQFGVVITVFLVGETQLNADVLVVGPTGLRDEYCFALYEKMVFKGEKSVFSYYFPGIFYKTPNRDESRLCLRYFA